MPEAQETTPAVPASPRRFEIPVLAEQTELPTPAPAASDAPAQNIGEQAPPAVSDGETPKEETPTPEQEAKRAGRRFERKLDKAIRRGAEAQARADLLEKELTELRTKATPPKVTEGRPKLEDFEYDPNKHAEAVEVWAKGQAEKEFQAKQRTESQKQFQERLTSSWDEKVESVEEKYADWREKVGDIKPDTPFTAAIFEAENGPDIAYYLGDNPKEALRIAQLPPLSQVREIGKLEAKLLAEPAKQKTPSKAPAPITPVSGTSAAVETNDLSDPNMSFEKFKKIRDKQVGRGR